jgi:muconolactone delta-isomerase
MSTGAIADHALPSTCHSAALVTTDGSVDCSAPLLRLCDTEGMGMQYLVTMTTHVPDGTPDATVAEVRAREAAHSADLAAQGHLLRLWRPPLQPGEWRSLGLFAADDDAQLEEVLASMPLRVWRSDQVTPLGAHPNDPQAPASTTGPEFLTTFTTVVPDGTPRRVVAQTQAREAQRAQELGRQGNLLRLWTLPDESRVLGLWRARDAADLETLLESLPLEGWMTVQTTPLTAHPSDPALASPAGGAGSAVTSE